MGLCNFIRSHVRNLAQIGSPLHALTWNNTRCKVGELPKDRLKAFNKLKMTLCSEPVVAYPRNNLSYSLIVDSATGNVKYEGVLGAILCQTNKKGTNKVVAYASRQLLKHKQIHTISSRNGSHCVGHRTLWHKFKRKNIYIKQWQKPLETHSKRHEKTLSRLQEAYTRQSFNIVYKKDLKCQQTV
jgi:hypothetical protein